MADADPEPQPPQEETQDYPEPLPFTPDPAQEAFAAAAPERLRRLVPILAVVLTGAAWPLFGWRTALGFAVGATVAAINFRWLEQGIVALLDRLMQSGQPASGSGAFFRFFLRFGLVATVAYATLYSYPGSLYGFLAGLFVPVVAILLEALHQTWAVLRGRA